MKVALVCKYIYPYVSGGVEVHVWNLANELTKRGHCVTIYALDKKNSPICDRSNEEIRSKQLTLSIFANISGLVSSLRSNFFDIIHYHGYRDPNVALSILLSNNCSKKIFTPHAIFPA